MSKTATGLSGTVKPNNYLSTIDTWGPEYTVVLDIMVHSAVSQWSSILRFANTDGDCCDIGKGQRVPAILYNSDGFLNISNGDYYTTPTIDLNKCYHIEINMERNLWNWKVSEFIV